MYNPNYINWGPQGWRCPSCGKVFAPHISECPYCNNQGVVYRSGTSIDDSEWWEEYLKQSQTGKLANDNPSTTTATTTSSPDNKVTTLNSTITCEQKCEDCDKYEKSCFGGIETTSTKAIISHRRPPEIIFQDGIWWEKYKEETSSNNFTSEEAGEMLNKNFRALWEDIDD
jgi:hypothetical protein